MKRCFFCCRECWATSRAPVVNFWESVAARLTGQRPFSSKMRVCVCSCCVYTLCITVVFVYIGLFLSSVRHCTKCGSFHCAALVRCICVCQSDRPLHSWSVSKWPNISYFFAMFRSFLAFIYKTLWIFSMGMVYLTCQLQWKQVACDMTSNDNAQICFRWLEIVSCHFCRTWSV